MKSFICITLFFLYLNTQAQTINHSTINQLEVSYKDSDIIIEDTIKMVRSQSSITLKSDTNLTAIHFKIIKESNNSVIYQVDYLMSSPTVTNPNGVVLFKKEGNVIYINSSFEIPLNLYQYQITTENSQGILSEPFTEFH